MNAIDACYQMYNDIEKIIAEKIKTIRYDRTFRAKITSQISANKYNILYKNKEYPVSCDIKAKVGDVVWVCAPENNWSRLYIQSRKPDDDTITQVNGVKGSAETDYKSGYVNISPEDIGLGKVNNTSDIDKPISTAVQNALNNKSPNEGSSSLNKLASQVEFGDGGAFTILQGNGTYRQKVECLDNATSGDAVFRFSQSEDSGVSYKQLFEIRDDGSAYTKDGKIYTTGNKPSKADVGLDSVPNVATNDQTPTFTQAPTLANISSGEKLSITLGKIVKAIADFITHKADSVIHITLNDRSLWNTVSNKVDSVPGMNLSTNDYSDTAMNKLSGISPGAEVNVQADWNVTDTASDAYIQNKPTSLPASDVSAWAKASTKPSYAWSEVSGKPSSFIPSAHTHNKSQITDMPTKLSQFDNDSAYITAADVDTSQNHTHANKSVLDSITQTLLNGWNTAFTHVSNKNNPHSVTASQIGAAASGHTHVKTDITDFPSSMPASGGDSATVNGHTVNTDVPTGAKFTDTVYTHPNSGVTAGTYKSVTVNTQGHVTGGTNPSTLAGYGITDAASASHNHNTAYAPIDGSASISKLGSSITLGDGGSASIFQNSGNVQQKVTISDHDLNGGGVYNFQLSTNAGAAFTNLMSILDNGTVKATIFDGAATSATKLQTERTIAIGGGAIGTATSFDGSSNVSIPITSIDASYLTGYSSTKRPYFNTHPENGGAILPFINNDLAFLTQKGGSMTSYKTSSTDYTLQTLTNAGQVSINTTAPFDGSPSYASFTVSNINDVIIIDIICHKVFTYSNNFYIDFGNAGWRAKDIRFYTYNSNTDNSEVAYKLMGSVTNNGFGQFVCNSAYTYINSGGTTVQGFNKLRVVLTNFQSVNPRIAAIGILSYNSPGLIETFISRGGGTVYGSISPHSNNVYTLGTTSNRWSNGYFETINVNSSSKVSNLNADRLDDQDGSYYLNYNNLKNTPVNKIITVTATDWTLTAPYTKTILVSGMKSTDAPSISPYTPKTMTSTQITATKKMTSYITDAETNDGSLTLYCGILKPTSEFQIMLIGVSQ